MGDELFPVDHHRMTGVIAALKANHHISRLSQQINNFAFTFVPPLRSDNDYVSHVILL
jgi:hypothetical protein